ncbi:hypothetical protein [Pontivivens ytuae]|uniref:Uncharacterized protein n=1 Tax=Pontivivens ytuae TaxID=2789856 RepID=A0A7S9LR71_9RHOB|nr:hypothetical protein [Pontivivens ytuae]QPH53758.1 hypothetical protein I0K15_18575 [Pontivivens ytuae]
MLIRALILMLLPTLCAAQVRYGPADLRRVEERAVPTIIAVFDEDILGNLPREMRPRAAGVTLDFPLEGPSPLSFYAAPATQTISMPLTSIRFFDDVATLFAWFEARGCEPGFIQSYLWGLLREGRPYPAPLEAFAIDRETALADPFAGDVSGKILSSGIQFILAHELGHLLLDHEAGMEGAASQAQEREADAFALDHFARLGGAPMGVFWYYMAAWWQDPVTEGRAASTHPVSPERIDALAWRLGKSPMDFAHGEADPAREAAFVREIAGMLDELSGLIDDDGMLTLMPLTLDRDFPSSRFATACPSG